MSLGNTKYFGNAKISYTASTGGTVTYQLPTPLRELVPSWRGTVFTRDSIDFTTRTIYTISSTASTGALEWVGTVRFVRDRPGLINLIKNGILGQVLTYKKTTSSTGEACYLIEPSDPMAVAKLDRGRAPFNDVEIQLRLRKTNLKQFSSQAL